MADVLEFVTECRCPGAEDEETCGLEGTGGVEDGWEWEGRNG